MEHSLAEALPSIGVSIKRDREAFSTVEPIQYKEEYDKGNEKPTLDGRFAANPKEAVNFLGLDNRKVFITASDNVFWGKGTQISFKGRQILSDMAALLMTVPNRIVISENDPFSVETSRDIGLERAWAVINYLTERKGLDKMRFSISASTVAAEEVIGPVLKNNRKLEIVILERSIYR
jgi:hypothetical protein